MILKWSYGLLHDTGNILLDRNTNADQAKTVYRTLTRDGRECVTDLYLWHINQAQIAAIVRIDSTNPKPPEYYKERLRRNIDIDHLTVEVNPRPHEKQT